MIITTKIILIMIAMIKSNCKVTMRKDKTSILNFLLFAKTDEVNDTDDVDDEKVCNIQKKRM